MNKRQLTLDNFFNKKLKVAKSDESISTDTETWKIAVGSKDQIQHKTDEMNYEHLTTCSATYSKRNVEERENLSVPSRNGIDMDVILSDLEKLSILKNSFVLDGNFI